VGESIGTGRGGWKHRYWMEPQGLGGVGGSTGTGKIAQRRKGGLKIFLRHVFPLDQNYIN